MLSCAKLLADKDGWGESLFADSRVGGIGIKQVALAYSSILRPKAEDLGRFRLTLGIWLGIALRKWL